MKVSLQFSRSWCLAIVFLLICCGSYAAASGHMKDMPGVSSKKTDLYADPVGGTVKDETGLPLPGVSVKIKGTSTGTQTGIDGQYTIDAQPGEILVFTYVGYVTKEITVGTGDTANVVLSTDSKNL